MDHKEHDAGDEMNYEICNLESTRIQKTTHKWQNHEDTHTKTKWKKTVKKIGLCPIDDLKVQRQEYL